MPPGTFHVYFKETESSPEVTIGYNEFKELIRQGKIGPKSLVLDLALTGNQWWPMDELNIFHNNSPVKYPLGPTLQQKHDYKKYWQERIRLSWEFPAEYIRGTLIEKSYGLAPLSELIKERSILGISRLYVLRSFEPERIFTFSFLADTLRVEVAQGATALCYSHPQVYSQNCIYHESSGIPFEPDKIWRRKMEIGYPDVPEPFQQFSTLETMTLAAPGCTSLMADGVSFRHQVRSCSGEMYAEWSNPLASEHPSQTCLLEAYQACVRAAGLEAFWKGKTPN